MSPVIVIVRFLVVSIVAGMFGAVALVAVMRLAARGMGISANMVVAVGSLLTRSKDNALMVGVFLHLISAVFFAMLYTLLMMALNCVGWPAAFFTGIGFGAFHGLVVSLSLCWVIADQHPIAEFREAGIPVALCHFAGHLAYGAAVGLVVALASSQV